MEYDPANNIWKYRIKPNILPGLIIFAILFILHFLGII